MKNLVQKSVQVLEAKGFTKHTIRMSFTNYWYPLASQYPDMGFSKELLDSYVMERYGRDIMNSDTHTLTKKQKRIRHAFYVLSEFRETGLIVAIPMIKKKMRYQLKNEDQEVLNQYIAYRKNEGDAEATLNNKKRTIHVYLLEISLNKHTLQTVQAYLIKLGSRLAKSSLKSKTTILRQFLTYCYQQELLLEDFSKLFLPIRNSAGLNVPDVFSPEDIQKLLQFMKQLHTPNHRRNYAIAVLLVSYGLRASEVQNLKLSDINWDSMMITVNRHKTRSYSTFDISTE